MVLRRHAAVLWRFRTIILTGFFLGLTVAVLAVAKVSTSGIEWRAQETWSSTSTLFVTQQGFPEGRVVLGDPSKTAPATATGAPSVGTGEPFADPGRFSNLAIVYSYLAQSDRVRGLITPRPRPSQVTVTPVPAAINSPETLPILKVETSAKDGTAARALNTAAITALRGFLEREQKQNDIAADNRVRVEILNPPTRASILVGRSKTPALVAFLLAMAGAVALAYCLDNLYASRTGAQAAAEPATEGPALEEVWSALPATTAQHDSARRAS